jgi:hypothetical protein
MKPDLSFPTKKEALEYLRSIDELEESSKTPGVFWETGTYYLSHGEYERPDYRVRRYKDGWGVHATYYYYAGTLYAPKDGRLLDDIWRLRRFSPL